MTNEEFQKLVLQELKLMNNRFDGLENRFDGLESRFDGLENRFDGLENKFYGLENRFVDLGTQFGELKEGHKRMEARQDEIYQVVRAIEHSNQVGRSELDSQNMRVAKLEGKFKKVAKAYNEDIEIDTASNL